MSGTQETQEKHDAESAIKRNPHGDFSKVQASRPDFEKRDWTFSKTPAPGWQYGSGGNDGGASLEKNHVDIDPYTEGRPAALNYKLLISAIVPRPIGFLSTRSKDGKSTNLSPFSYSQVINHDPPLFIGKRDRIVCRLQDQMLSGQQLDLLAAMTMRKTVSVT